jgi:protein-S-isoprenylcysteine O-methyltransferase Ste14
VAGLVLTLRSAARIDVWDLAGVRQARAASSTPSTTGRPSVAPALEVRGAYRWVRHPIYLGWVLMIFGAPFMTTGRLLFAGVSTAYLVAAIPLEERSLTEEFGPAYTAYQRQVRWRLVPGVW